MSSTPPTVLNIPKVAAAATPTTAASPAPSSASAVDHPASAAASDAASDAANAADLDDGRSGKLTLSMLIAEGLIEPGEGVLTIDYLGQTFKGDLLKEGKIKSQVLPCRTTENGC